MIQFLFKVFNNFVFKFATKIEVVRNPAAEKICGGLVVTANHLGFLDGFMIYHATWREDVIVLIAEHWREHGWSRLLVRAMDAIFVERYQADVRAVREVMRRLAKGGMLTLAPEGTRSHTGALIEPNDGAAYLAMKAAVPVVPAAITGTEDPYVIACWKKFRRPRIKLVIGEPFHPPPLPSKGRNAAVAAFTEEIMCQIAALLPEQYHGIYQGHPRVAEISDSNG